MDERQMVNLRTFNAAVRGASMPAEPSIDDLTRKYRDRPGLITPEERDRLRDAEVINADGDLYEDTPVEPETETITLTVQVTVPRGTDPATVASALGAQWDEDDGIVDWGDWVVGPLTPVSKP